MLKLLKPDELSDSASYNSFEADFFWEPERAVDKNKNAQLWKVNSFLAKPSLNHLKWCSLMIQLGEIPGLHQAKGKQLMKNLVNLTKKQDGIR